MDRESFRRLVEDYKGRLIGNKYRIVAGLGYGSYALVFLGEEPLRNRLVAVKRFLIDRSTISKAVSEIEGMDVLSGKPHVIQCFGYEHEELDPKEKATIDAGGGDHLRFYIIMEFGGQTLEAYLRRFGAEVYRERPTKEDMARFQAQAAVFVSDILVGLHWSHKEHLIHRDIKPANIYISHNGETKIGDFGVAKQVVQEGLHSGTIVGTALYMAPEQIVGGKYGSNVDLFATGVILYRMLGGRMPFRDAAEVQTRDPELKIPGASKTARSIIEKALRKDPKTRYQKATDMHKDIQKWMSEIESAHPGCIQAERERIRENAWKILDAEVRDRIRAMEAGSKAEDVRKQEKPETVRETPASVPEAKPEAKRPASVPPEPGTMQRPTSRSAARYVVVATALAVAVLLVVLYIRSRHVQESSEEQAPPPPPAVMEIALNEQDAVLDVDGTPIQGEPVARAGSFVWTVRDLPAGAHRVTALLPGSCFEDETEEVTLAAGETKTVRLDFDRRRPAKLFVSARDEDGIPLKDCRIKVDGKDAGIGTEGLVKADLRMGLKYPISISAPDRKSWKQVVTMEQSELHLSPVLSLKKRPEPPQQQPARPEKKPPPPPIRKLIVKAGQGSAVLINGAECTNPGSGCRFGSKSDVRVFVVDYNAGTAWQQTFPQDSVPPQVSPTMAACTRNVVLVSEPWAYVSMRNHRGEAVSIPVSALEERPQTPKRLRNCPCGVYRVRFHQPKKDIDQTVRIVIGPGSRDPFILERK